MVASTNALGPQRANRTPGPSSCRESCRVFSPLAFVRTSESGWCALGESEAQRSEETHWYGLWVWVCEGWMDGWMAAGKVGWLRTEAGRRGDVRGRRGGNGLGIGGGGVGQVTGLYLSGQPYSYKKRCLNANAPTHQHSSPLCRPRTTGLGAQTPRSSLVPRCTRAAPNRHTHLVQMCAERACPNIERWIESNRGLCAHRTRLASLRLVARARPSAILRQTYPNPALRETHLVSGDLATLCTMHEGTTIAQLIVTPPTPMPDGNGQYSPPDSRLSVSSVKPCAFSSLSPSLLTLDAQAPPADRERRGPSFCSRSREGTDS